MEVTIPDVEQLKIEAGAGENAQRLRAIVAERRVHELEAEVAALKASKESTNATQKG